MVDSSNPYRAPKPVPEHSRTPNGYTIAACVGGFLVIGGIAGLGGGAAMVLLILNRFPATAVLLAPGIAFGFALNFAVERLIGRITISRRLLLIPGCLFGFAVVGLLLEPFAMNRWIGALSWPWDNYASYLSASAAGFLVTTAVVCLTCGLVRWRHAIATWLIGTLTAFTAILVATESERQIGYPIIMTFVCNIAFQMIALGLIGWQIASARATAVATGGASG